MSQRKVIVVGASSGIGAELARQMVARGDRVAALARREDRLIALKNELGENVIPIVHDVQNTAEIPALFQELCRLLDGLDVIVYASGVMPEVGPSEFNFEKDEPMIDVNFKGGVAWLNEAAVRFQNVKHGTIIGIGSVAGERGRQGQPVYNASKAAFKAYLEALRNRLSKHGVKVVTIKPGPTDTEMTASLGMRGLMPVEQAARLILKKSEKGNEHFLKFTHKVAFALIRNFPSAIFRKLKV